MGGGVGLKDSGGVLHGVLLKDMWMLDVDRGVWSEVSELISLVYDELYQECMLYVLCCCLHTCGCVP